MAMIPSLRSGSLPNDAFMEMLALGILSSRL